MYVPRSVCLSVCNQVETIIIIIITSLDEVQMEP